MADGKISPTQFSNAVDIAASANATPKREVEKKDIGGLSSNDFLKLLVNQLQNQDPLNPMDSQQFAAQLAQYTSVEQLIGINTKLDKMASGATSAASMASFIGREVALADQESAEIESGSGPNVMVDLKGGMQSVRVDLTDANGGVVGSVNLENIQEGKNIIKLNGLNAADGSYKVRVVGVDSVGRFQELEYKLTGTVDGFVLEPEPKLLVGSQELGLAEVKAVYDGV